MNSNLKLIVLDNIEELGVKTDEILKELEHTTDSHVIPITRDRFNNGERITYKLRHFVLFLEILYIKSY